MTGYPDVVMKHCDALYDGSAEEAIAAAHALCRFLIEMVDTRGAMSAVAYALTRPELEVQRAAVFAAQALADEGGHAEMALGALLLQRDNADPEIRREVWRTLSDLAFGKAERYVHHVIVHFAERALAHADEDVRGSATRIVERAKRPRS